MVNRVNLDRTVAMVIFSRRGAGLQIGTSALKKVENVMHQTSYLYMYIASMLYT